MAYKLQLGNLSDATSDHDLHSLFAPTGVVSATSVIKDDFNHAATGFAVIRTTTHVDTQKAIGPFNTDQLDERLLTASLVKPRHVRSSGRPRRF